MLKVEIAILELCLWYQENPEEAGIFMSLLFLSYEFFRGTVFPGMVFLSQGVLTTIWFLIFLIKLFSRKFCSFMGLVCPCYFLIYVWYLEIYFSPNCIISLHNRGRQNSKMLLKIFRIPSPSIHAPSNYWDCKFDRFYSHGQVILFGTIDIKKGRLSGWV